MFDFDHNINEGLASKVISKSKEKKPNVVAEELSNLSFDDVESILYEELEKSIGQSLMKSGPSTLSEKELVYKDLKEAYDLAIVAYCLWRPCANNKQRIQEKVTSLPRLETEDPYIYIRFKFKEENEELLIETSIQFHNGRTSKKILMKPIDEDYNNLKIVYAFLSLVKILYTNHDKIAKELDQIYMDTCQPSSKPMLFWPTNGMFPNHDNSPETVNHKFAEYLERLVGQVGFTLYKRK